MNESPRIWRIQFGDEDHPYLHVTNVAEITLNGVVADLTFSGSLADKLRKMNEAFVRFETERRWVDGHELIADITEALK
jgi:hypothetical protein